MIAVIARSDNNVIGKDGTIPWKCKEDLAFFKGLTMDNAIVVGRKTYEKLPPLKGRTIYVLSHTKRTDLPDNVISVTTPEEVPNDAIVCGGKEIYNVFLDRIDVLYLSTIHTSVEGDTFFDEHMLDNFVRITRLMNDDILTIERYVYFHKEISNLRK